jgi:hypothetical protein
VHNAGAEEPNCGAYLKESEELRVKSQEFLKFNSARAKRPATANSTQHSALKKEGHLSALARQLTS